MTNPPQPHDDISEAIRSLSRIANERAVKALESALDDVDSHTDDCDCVMGPPGPFPCDCSARADTIRLFRERLEASTERMVERYRASFETLGH